MLRKVAEEFDKWAEDGLAQSMADGHADVAFQILDRLPFSSGLNVCDVGCGNGWLVREMMRRGAIRGYGFDISPKMVSLAEDTTFSGAFFGVANAADLPLESSSIDYLVSIESLYYHFNPADSLREWHRILKKGGTLSFMVNL